LASNFSVPLSHSSYCPFGSLGEVAFYGFLGRKPNPIHRSHKAGRGARACPMLENPEVSFSGALSFWSFSSALLFVIAILRLFLIKHLFSLSNHHYRL